MKGSTLKYVLLITVSLLCICGFSQEWEMTSSGVVKDMGTDRRLDGVTVIIKKNGSVWKTLALDSKAKFDLVFEPDGDYMVEFTKPGYVTKRIAINTENAPAEDAEFGFDFPFKMNLFEKMDGLDVSVLDQPVAKIKYDPNIAYMGFDEEYSKSVWDKMEELKVELAERLRKLEAERRAKQKKYDGLLSEAEGKFSKELYDDAKALYEEASALFPKEELPKTKISEINTLLGDQAAITKQYNDLIQKADGHFSAKKWEDAKKAYEKAKSIKPKEDYPLKQLTAIKEELERLADLQAKIDKLMATADGLLANENFQKAKDTYGEVLEIDPENVRAKEMFNSIKVPEPVDKDQEAYEKAIEKADELFKQQEWIKAKSAYEKALEYKSEEQYPKDQIAEIDTKLAEGNKKEQYDNLIIAADGLFDRDDYLGAKGIYQQALGVFPNEKYPKVQLEKIEAALAKQSEADQNALAVEAEKKKRAYFQSIVDQADNLYDSEEYQKAIEKYKEALLVLPEEQYPKDQIAKIEGILKNPPKKDEEISLSFNKDDEDQKAYDAIIKKADDLFADEAYRDALIRYQEALKIKPKESYPPAQIDAINAKLKELEDLANKNQSEKDKQKALEKKYNDFIYQADRDFKLKNYEEAKANYESAISVFDDRPYPKKKLEEVEKAIANQKKAADSKKEVEDYGPKKKITNDKEKEFEDKIAKILAEREKSRAVDVDQIRKELAQQERLRQQGQATRNQKYIDQNKQYVADFRAQKEQRDEISRDAAKQVEVLKSQVNQVERDRIQDQNQRRRKSEVELTVLAEQQNKTLKEFSQRRQKNIKEFDAYVSSTQEIELTYQKRADNIREEQRKELAVLQKQAIRLDKLGQKKRNDDVKKVKEYQTYVADLQEGYTEGYDRRVKKQLRDLKEQQNYSNSVVQSQNAIRDKRVNYVANLKQMYERLTSKREDKAARRREVAEKEMSGYMNSLSKVYENYEKRAKEHQEALEYTQKRNNEYYEDLNLLADKRRMEFDKEDFDFPSEKDISYNKDIVDKYGQGITEESREEPNAFILTRFKVEGKKADVYERVFYKWGGSFYTKNGVHITKALWDKETNLK